MTIRPHWPRSGHAPRLLVAAACAALALGALAGPCSAAMADAVAPMVTVTAPTAGATVTGQIPLGADAADDVGAVGVRWYLDGLQIASDTGGAPWSAAWDSARIANGVHKVFAKARDADGNWGSSPSVSFTVDNPPVVVDTIAPTIAVTAPKWGEEVQGSAATLSAKAFDNVGVTGVKWYVDGTPVAFDYGGAPWTRSWDSRQFVNGVHRVFAKARDAAGNWTSSASVSFSVGNEPCGAGSAPPVKWDHVVWIVFENKSYSQIIGSPDAPYLNGLAAGCGLATDYHGLAHPSLANYIAMTSGSTQGITDDSGPSSHPLTAPSIFSQLGPGGWRALQESMPSNCYLTNSGLYAARHNPAAYYVNVSADCALQDVPLGPQPDLSAPFTFITPNLCHDMHSSPCATTAADQVAAGDAWLAQFLPTVFATPEYRAGSTAVFITWDEDDFSDEQRVPTLVVAPPVAPGTAVATTFDHYSLLRTTEEMLGLDTYLANAATATSMRDGFGL
jgi:phosphatidylinositol-3-phosphatase